MTDPSALWKSLPEAGAFGAVPAERRRRLVGEFLEGGRDDAIAELLKIDSGLTTALDENGHTPLQERSLLSDERIYFEPPGLARALRLLFKHGANPCERGKYGRNAFECAMSRVPEGDGIDQGTTDRLLGYCRALLEAWEVFSEEPARDVPYADMVDAAERAGLEEAKLYFGALKAKRVVSERISKARAAAGRGHAPRDLRRGRACP